MGNEQLTTKAIEKLLQKEPELVEALLEAASEDDANRLLEEKGYAFTVNDLNEMLTERELTEDELDRVSGGFFHNIFTIFR